MLKNKIFLSLVIILILFSVVLVQAEEKRGEKEAKEDKTNIAKAKPFQWLIDGDNIFNKNSGNVGIGTDRPRAKLDVKGDIHASGIIKSGEHSITINGPNNAISTGPGNDIDMIADEIHMINEPDDIKVGIRTTQPTETLDVRGTARVRKLPVNNELNEVVVADNTGVLHKRDATTLPGGADDDWTGAGTTQMYATYLDDDIGIGTTNPEARLHVNRDIDVSNEEVAKVTFSNAIPSIGAYGMKVISKPLESKGTQIGVRADTSKTAGPDPQRGSATGILARVTGWHRYGAAVGVQGEVAPKVLSNYNDGQTSFGLGGRFIARIRNLILDNVGTYWIGGSYNEIIGTIDNTPALGAIAAVIGVDNTKGSAESYAGYFQGRARVTELPLDNNLNNIVVADTDGVLHVRDVSTLAGSGADNDWDTTTNAPNMFALPAGNVGIGTTSPQAKLEIAGQVKITGGNPASGKVLTSDASGLATWENYIPQDSWQAITLNSGFTSFGVAPQYYKDSLGRVHLRGGIEKISATPFIVFVLPGGYVPSNNFFWQVLTYNTPVNFNNPVANGVVFKAENTGDFKVYNMAQDQVIILDGISYLP